MRVLLLYILMLSSVVLAFGQNKTPDFYDYMRPPEDSQEVRTIKMAERMYQYDLDKRALKTLKDEIANDPGFYNGYLFLGYLYYEQRSYGESLNWLNQAIDVDGTYPFGYFLRGNTYLAMGKYTQALNDFGKTIALDPTFYGAYNNIAVVNVLNQSSGGAHPRDFKMARDNILEVLEKLEPNDPRVYFNLGFMYIMLGMYQQAVPQLDKAVALDPNYGKAQYYKGLAHYYLREYAAAKQSFNLAYGVGYRKERCREFNNFLVFLMDYMEQNNIPLRG